MLKTSDAYVRRLLLRERLFGVKVGQVWAIYKEDLENFQRLRRPPGRPRKVVDPGAQDGEIRRIDAERSHARFVAATLRGAVKVPGTFRTLSGSLVVDAEGATARSRSMRPASTRATGCATATCAGGTSSVPSSTRSCAMSCVR